MDKIGFLGSENEISRVPFGSILKETREKTTVENEDTLLSCAINGIFRNDELFSHFRGRSTIGYVKVKKNDLILSAQNLHLGNANVNLRFEHGIISPAYKVYRITGAEPEYIAQWVKRPTANQFFLAATTEGASQCRKNIDWDALYKQCMELPSLEEQKEIAKLLMSLDSKITFEKTEVRKLKDFKSAMLTKMFPKEGEKEPEIRFDGFTDAWAQRKLADIVERITRKNENLESTLPLTISAQYGLIDQNEFFDKRIASKDVSGYYLVRKGEFAYNKSTSSDAPWGAIKRLDRYECGVLSTLYIVFRILDEDKINSDYLVTYYDTDLWHKGVQAIAAEGARNHGLLNITPADYFETTVSVPKDIEEQIKIGTYFMRLDHLITLHQRKYEKLIDAKKAFLEKMIGGEK